MHREPGEAAWVCDNVACPAVRLRSVEHFVSGAGLDVKGIGKKWVEQLVQAGRVKTPADLFTLTAKELLDFERMGETLAEKFVDALAQAKDSAPLYRFISALGIRHVGEQTARALAGRFAGMDALARASLEELTAIPDVGPEVAGSIQSFFANPANQAMLEDFRGAGLWPQAPSAAPKLTILFCLRENSRSGSPNTARRSAPLCSTGSNASSGTIPSTDT